jgi:SAM-dependent methyltransferase
MNTAEIQIEIGKYKWYHCIEVGGCMTPGIEGFMPVCHWALNLLKKYDLNGKNVLDVGARDCFFSLNIERMGAAEIDAIDNDLSAGAKNFLLPFFNSKTNLQHLSLYDLPGSKLYDAIVFFGVLYHLRYPFRGLRTLVDNLKIGGTLFIEGGFLSEPSLQHLELLHCPVDTSPYDPSSCTFFNPLALDTTLRHMGCEKIEGMQWYGAGHPVDRGFAVYRKVRDQYYDYWEPGGKHTYHTRAAHSREDFQPTTAAPYKSAAS